MAGWLRRGTGAQFLAQYWPEAPQYCRRAQGLLLLSKEGAGMQIGERIAAYRKRRGMSQDALAGLVGMSRSWLSQVERGMTIHTC